MNLALGMGFLGLGVLGAFLPVLPSTCFFICATYFFGKSSARLEAWVLNHPRFGHAVRSWRETRSIPLAGKIAAVVGMSVSALFLVISPAPLWAILSGFAVLALSAWYVLSRPTLSREADLSVAE
ncbi:MAG: YbaN family protein [Pseudobdellovibrionaceae bacterium]